MVITSADNLKPAENYTCTSIDGAVKLRIGEKGCTAMRPETLVELFQESCKKNCNLPALCYEDPSESKWITVTYVEYAERVEQAALMFLQLGLQKYDTVGILAHNCPEWLYAEYACLHTGGVIFGIYPTSSVDAILHMLSLTSASMCIVDTAEQMAKIRECHSQLPKLRVVIQLQGPYEDFIDTQEGYYRWEDVINQKSNDSFKSELKLRERNIYANECALLVFTSGTTNLPKAVMMSHDAIIFSVKNTCDLIREKAGISGNFVSYLPLCHMAAQFFENFSPLYTRGCTYFADKEAIKSTLIKTLITAKPTLVFGVPRVYEKIRERIFTDFGNEATEKCLNEKVKKAVGLENCKALLCTGAPLHKDLIEFLINIDLPINNSYGSTETGCLTVNFDRNNQTSVGPTVKGIECKIDGGEICFRGRNMLMGYLSAPKATAEVLDEDGWFHTGDSGLIDSFGHINITGRIKELIITSGGENIPPLRIEELLKQELPAISNAMVVGDNRKYLTVLITLKTHMHPDTGAPLDSLHEDTKKWLHDLDFKYERLTEVFNIPPEQINYENFSPKIHTKMLESIQDAIKRTNSQALARPHHIQKFTILPHDFSVVTNELGPTLKLRRKIVVEKYKNIIDRMYA